MTFDLRGKSLLVLISNPENNDRIGIMVTQILLIRRLTINSFLIAE